MPIRAKLPELAVAVALFIAITALGASFQQRNGVNEGRGIDGVWYHHVAHLLESGQPIVGRAPFVYRPGTPWLATLAAAPEDLLEGFLRVNLVANLATVLLFTLWLSLFVDSLRVRMLVGFLFQAHWFGQVRYVFYYPALVDPWAQAVSLAFLLVVFAWPEAEQEKARRAAQAALLAGLAAIGATMRENLILLSAALLLHASPGQGGLAPRDLLRFLLGRLRLAALPLLAGGLALLWVRASITGRGYPGYAAMALNELNQRSAAVWVYAWFITYGPILSLTLFDWRASVRFLIDRPYLAAIGIAGAALSLLGGPDTERFLGWLFPVVLVLVGLAIERLAPLLRRPWVWGPLAIAQLLSMRLFWTAPEASCTKKPLVLLTRIGECATGADLVSVHASPAAREIGMAQYSIAVGLLLGLLWLASRVQSTRAREEAA